MTRIYANRSFARRMTASTIVCVLAFLFGFFELWQAFNAPAGESGYGYIFAAFFIFGGIYGFRQIAGDYADTVVTLESDGGAARITLWQPLRSKVVEGPLNSLSNWRREMKGTGHARREMLVADYPGHPRPLRFETGKGVVETETFSKLRATADDS